MVNVRKLSYILKDLFFREYILKKNS